MDRSDMERTTLGEDPGLAFPDTESDDATVKVTSTMAISGFPFKDRLHRSSGPSPPESEKPTASSFPSPPSSPPNRTTIFPPLRRDADRLMEPPRNNRAGVESPRIAISAQADGQEPTSSDRMISGVKSLGAGEPKRDKGAQRDEDRDSDDDDYPYSDSDESTVDPHIANSIPGTPRSTAHSVPAKSRPVTVPTAAKGRPWADYPEIPARNPRTIINVGQPPPSPVVNERSDPMAVAGTGLGLRTDDTPVEETRKRIPSYDARSVGSASVGARGRQSDLADWAPRQATPSRGAANLPDFENLDSRSLTSHPNSLIQHDLDYSLRRLLTERVFEDLLNDPLGRFRMRDYLSRMDDTSQLDLWQDVHALEHLLDRVKHVSQAMYDVYLSPSSSQLHRVELPPKISDQVITTLQQINNVQEAVFSPLYQHLVRSMYTQQFQSFVRTKIVEESSVRLGRLDGSGVGGLGDCFCLTNPRLRDHPIVLVSDGFTSVTGYSRESIVGRNCRFLQGPGTAPESVQRIRNGLNSGDGCTELLLNYRKDGTPFYCLLCIIPLRDASGSLVYFLGGQVNVTGQLAGGKDLGFLLGGSSSDSNFSPESMLGSPASGQGPGSDFQFSPMLRSFNSPSMSDSPDRDGGGAFDTRSLQGAAGQQGLSPKVDGVSPLTSKVSGVTFGRLFGGVGGGSKKKATALRGGFDPLALDSSWSDKLVDGAEGSLGSASRPIKDQLSLFKDVYQKVIVFKTEKREVIFVTRQLLSFFGLPCSRTKEIYNSPLLHADILEVLRSTNGDKSDTKKLRETLKAAIKRGEAVSVVAGIRSGGGRRFFGGNATASVLKNGVLHLTPIREREGNAVAYVGIFG